MVWELVCVNVEDNVYILWLSRMTTANKQTDTRSITLQQFQGWAQFRSSPNVIKCSNLVFGTVNYYGWLILLFPYLKYYGYYV